jgi:hypothetical protein
MALFSFRFPLSIPPQEKQLFRFLGKARPSYFSPMFARKESTKPFIVHLLGKLRIRQLLCWPKFFATFQKYNCPIAGANDALADSVDDTKPCLFRLKAFT